MKILHLELTNRCILQCPACPRTEWANILKRPISKVDLDYTLLDPFLDCPGGKEIDTFRLCGDYGDALYYPKLLEFIKHFRNTKKFILHTNGSKQTVKFWQQLAELLTDQDQIIFGIDGLEDTNHFYRRNSHWSSIMTGLEIMCNSHAKVRWQTIVFSFNQDKLDKIKLFAESKGAEFFTLKTHRYGDASFVPDLKFVQVDALYKESYNNESPEVDPQCMRTCTIGSDGIFYPCDWLRNPNTLYKSPLWKNKSQWLDKLKIANTTYDRAELVIADWASTVKHNSLNNGPVDVLCKMKCRKCK